MLRRIACAVGFRHVETSTREVTSRDVGVMAAARLQRLSLGRAELRDMTAGAGGRRRRNVIWRQEMNHGSPRPSRWPWP